MSELGTTMQCIQLMLFLLNFVFLVIGFVIIAIGAASLGNFNAFEIFVESLHFKPAEILIACGAVLLFVSFIGCIGALSKSTVMVNMYVLLLFIVLIMEIVGTIMAFAMRCNITEDIENSLKYALHEYKSLDSVRKAWDFTQENLQCCGVHHPHDWASQHIDGPIVKRDDGVEFTVPFTCCDEEDQCRSIYRKGCLTVLGSYVSDASLLMVYIGGGIGIIQIFSVFFAWTLGKGIRYAKTELEMERQQNRQRIYEQALMRYAAPPYLSVSSVSEG